MVETHRRRASDEGREDCIPSINIDELDPEVDLDMCRGTRSNIRCSTLMKNSFGFGGINCVSILDDTVCEGSAMNLFRHRRLARHRRGDRSGKPLRARHDVAFTYVTNDDACAKVCRRGDARNSPGRTMQSLPARCPRVPRRGRSSRRTRCSRISRSSTSWSPMPASIGNNLVVSMSDEEWDDVIQTNLTGAFYVCRQFLPTMLAKRFGRIVLISSLGHSGVSGQANYAPAKPVLLGLSRRWRRNTEARASPAMSWSPASSKPT